MVVGVAVVVAVAVALTEGVGFIGVGATIRPH